MEPDHLRTLALLTSLLLLMPAAAALEVPVSPGPATDDGTGPAPVVLVGTIDVLEIGVGDCPLLDEHVVVSTLTKLGGGYATVEGSNETHRYAGVSVSSGDIDATCETWDGFTFLTMEIRQGVLAAGF